ncbi:hypothetical protein CLOHAE12215_01459 [Clostridium haemolyticum]|uniref:hypothetical protein n=1 Tax=Clostridium haemolyticum TaxID=84025 RepID=UPI001C3A9AEB|nr:hypothetical protein [Clostridium haemolyticum]CAG7840043.1 hypothetical protein CLOHAE12215_01459 [Clostridium haemolyticum]
MEIDEMIEDLTNKYNALKLHVIKELNEIINCVNTEQYYNIQEWQDDKEESYINFSIDPDEKQTLTEAITILTEYKDEIEEFKCAKEVHDILNL